MGEFLGSLSQNQPKNHFFQGYQEIIKGAVIKNATDWGGRV